MNHWNVGWVLGILAAIALITIAAYFVGLSTGRMQGRRGQLRLGVGRVFEFGGTEYVLTDVSVDLTSETMRIGLESHQAWRERMMIA